MGTPTAIHVCVCGGGVWGCLTHCAIWPPFLIKKNLHGTHNTSLELCTSDTLVWGVTHISIHWLFYWLHYSSFSNPIRCHIYVSHMLVNDCRGCAYDPQDCVGTPTWTCQNSLPFPSKKSVFSSGAVCLAQCPSIDLEIDTFPKLRDLAAAIYKGGSCKLI